MDDFMSGRCQCGAVTYRCSAPPIFTVNCHCLACQRTSGAAYVSALRVPAAALQVTGEVRRSIRVGDSGQHVQNGFCAACGSRMFSYAESMEGSVGLFAASLDDQSWYRPQFNIYVARAPHWHVVDRSIPCFDTTPSPDEAAQLLAKAR